LIAWRGSAVILSEDGIAFGPLASAPPSRRCTRTRARPASGVGPCQRWWQDNC